jgi:ribulose-5-phosphate 4-epimerase/fuculose-1-phosphate aldolase
MIAANAGLSLRAELATANHILFDQGILDAFGHVSVRHPDNPDRFLLSRNLSPALVTAGDVLEFDLDGNALEAKGARVYLERFIHGEIYRERPDVAAVVHSHSASVLQFTIAPGVRLCPVCHMAGFLKADTPVFEIRGSAGGGSDLLIRSGELGRDLAHCLGGHAVILMRGHGFTAVGGSLQQAVFRAVYAEVNARVQAAALGLSPSGVTALNDAEASAADAANNGQIGRAWDFWSLRAKQTAASFRTTSGERS